MLGIDLNGIEAVRHETRMHVLTEPCCINVARIEHQAVVLSVQPQRVDGFDKTFHFQSVEAPLLDRCIDACRWERQHFDAPTVLFGTASEFTVHVLPLFWTEALGIGDAKILENADVGFRDRARPDEQGADARAASRFIHANHAHRITPNRDRRAACRSPSLRAWVLQGWRPMHPGVLMRLDLCGHRGRWTPRPSTPLVERETVRGWGSSGS